MFSVPTPELQSLEKIKEAVGAPPCLWSPDWSRPSTLPGWFLFLLIFYRHCPLLISVRAILNLLHLLADDLTSYFTGLKLKPSAILGIKKERLVHGIKCSTEFKEDKYSTVDLEIRPSLFTSVKTFNRGVGENSSVSVIKTNRIMEGIKVFPKTF